MENTTSILDFWFGAGQDDAAVAEEKKALWWSKKPETDEEIRRRFQTLVLSVEGGLLDGWRGTPEGRLALILLTDQFPRNIFRDTPEAFRFGRFPHRNAILGRPSTAEELEFLAGPGSSF